MAKRTGAVHVSTTRRHYKGKVYETTLLRRSYREGGKVRNETVGNLSHLPPEVIAAIRAMLAGGRWSTSMPISPSSARCPTATWRPCSACCAPSTWSG